jgi:hypothetical protein
VEDEEVQTDIQERLLDQVLQLEVQGVVVAEAVGGILVQEILIPPVQVI